MEWTYTQTHKHTNMQTHKQSEGKTISSAPHCVERRIIILWYLLAIIQNHFDPEPSSPTVHVMDLTLYQMHLVICRPPPLDYKDTCVPLSNVYSWKILILSWVALHPRTLSHLKVKTYISHRKCLRPT